MNIIGFTGGNLLAIDLSTAGVTLQYAVESTSGTMPTTGFTVVPGIKAIPDLNPEPSSLETTTLEALELSLIHIWETPRVIFDVFTREKYFRVSGGVTGEVVTGTPIVGTAIEVLSEADNVLHEIPIIEYQYENNRMGSFEAVIPLLDEINNIQSNRVDGIEQFVQSLMIFYNCQLGEDEKMCIRDSIYIDMSIAFQNLFKIILPRLIGGAFIFLCLVV